MRVKIQTFLKISHQYAKQEKERDSTFVCGTFTNTFSNVGSHFLFKFHGVFTCCVNPFIKT